MDSPVIIDTASKFGRDLDLDRDFPGFPGDDEGFGRRGDIRSHLNDLAARHPEFADHLLGSAWGDVPFNGGSLRSRRRGSNSSNPFHNHPDEDVRSQSSSGSAGSGVSSHGEPEPPAPPPPQFNQSMENNFDKNNARNQRSMSAPPENRQQQDNNPQRFVSRVEITPQNSQDGSQDQQQQPSSPTQQRERESSPGPQKPQTPSNVRHIPIFVEGRDKPVIPKEVDDTDFPKRQQSPPQFHRPSHFQQQHFKPHSQPHWTSKFQDPFFENAERRWGRNQEPIRPHAFRQTNQTPETKFRPTQHQQQQQPPQQRHHPAPQPQAPEPSEPPKPAKPAPPKDPLERVAWVQQEVDSLTEQVKQFNGSSRQDKQYMYLDEMLTRELIKLDDIETEGKENVRQARKTAIKSIQNSISLLESKVPLPGQEAQTVQEEQNESQSAADEMNEVKKESVEAMETQQVSQEETLSSEQAIPLPPCPAPTENLEETSDKIEEQPGVEPQTADEPMDSTPAVKEPSVEPMDIARQSPPKESAESNEQSQLAEQPAPVAEEKANEGPAESEKTKTPDKKPAKSPKKARKSKNPPAPISETAIPLPAPEESKSK